LSQKKAAKGSEIIFIISAIKTWLFVTVPLLAASAFILSVYQLKSEYIGYISSAISFVGAVFAGTSAARCKYRSQLIMGAFTAAILVIMLLTVGFLIDSAAITPDSVISVVSFTFAGCLSGSVLLSGRGQKTSRRRKKRKIPIRGSNLHNTGK